MSKPPPIVSAPAVRDTPPPNGPGFDFGMVVWPQGPIPGPAGLVSAVINVTALGDNVLIPGAIGKQILVYKMFLVMAAPANLIFKDGAGNDLTGSMAMLANGSIVLDESSDFWFQTSAGNAFILNLSAIAQASGRIYFTQQ